MAITRASQARDVGSIPIRRYCLESPPQGGLSLFFEVSLMGIDPEVARDDRSDEPTGCWRKPPQAAWKEQARGLRLEGIPIKHLK